MKIVFLLLFHLLILGCKSINEKNINSRLYFENNTFEDLSNSTSIYNSNLEHEFRRKASDPISAEKAKSIWALFFTIRDSSENLCKIFDEVKSQLKFVFKEDSVHYRREFDPKLASDNMYNAISRNTSFCLNLSTEIHEIFTKQFDVDPLRGLHGRIDKNEFYDIIFKDRSYHELISGINLLKARVKNFENALLAFCNNKISSHGPFYTSYGILIGQSSNILKSGEKLTISAGVGTYSTKAEARIKIGNDTVPVLYGSATKTIKISGKKGRYKVPVEIDFKDETGERHIEKRDVEYTIYK